SRHRSAPTQPGSEADLRPSRLNVRSPQAAITSRPWGCPISTKRWGNRPISLWIAEEIGCCASGWWGNEVRVCGLKHPKEKRSMAYFAGLDVAVKETSICIVDDTGKIVRQARVASEPEALLQVLTNNNYRFKRIGLEAGPLSQWLFSALAEAG